MLKHVFKFGLDILPSVVATIIGAYIVNHYIATKPAANAPVSATASTAEPKNADIRTDAKPSEAASVDRFVVKRQDRTQFVRAEDVDWIESDGN